VFSSRFSKRLIDLGSIAAITFVSDLYCWLRSLDHWPVDSDIARSSEFFYEYRT